MLSQEVTTEDITIRRNNSVRFNFFTSYFANIRIYLNLLVSTSFLSLSLYAPKRYENVSLNSLYEG